MRLRLALALLAGAVCLSTLGLVPAHANGILVGGDRTGAADGRLQLVEHRVQATVKDQVADVTVEQVFRSTADRQLEGTYLFPLPKGAVVSRFAMTMGGAMVEGEVVEAGEARRIYEGIVRRRRDPGLLEYVGRGLFRAKVFPIEPHRDLTIRLAYQQVLPEDQGTLELRYPLSTERFQTGVVQQVLVDVTVESSVDLKAVYSGSHPVEVTRDGDRKARITYESAGRRQDKDFLLYVARSPEDVGFSFLSHHAVGEDGTFMAVLAPRATLADDQRVPKDVVFVLDTSGSMAGEKMAQAKRSLAYGIRTLHGDDRFNVVAFATSVTPFRDAFLEATTEAKEAAVTWTDALDASGGTNIEGALVEALRRRSGDRLFLLVFLTDGEPTVGARDAETILASVKKANPQGARVFTFGIHHDIDVALLDRIAEATGGARDYLGPDEDLEIATGRFFRKINAPVLCDLHVDLGGGTYDVYPPKLGDLFAGEQLVLFGRYREGGGRTISLKGRVGAREIEYQVATVFATGEGATFLPRLWAHRKVAFLLDEIRLHGAAQELVDEVVRLATRHAIVTPYTAGLVVEEMRELGGVAGEPRILDAELGDHVETDNDRPFDGPAHNGAIGLGGAAGGAFRGRGGNRDLATGGGGKRTMSAVDDTLAWLAARQGPDGSWAADGADAGAFGDVGTTGLALQTFLAAGYTNRGRHAFAKVVSKGLRSLKNVQDAEGAFGPRSGESFLLEHAMASLAMVEAFGMTGSPIFRNSAQKALDVLARNPPPDDPLLVAFHALPLVSARLIVEDALRRGQPAPLDYDVKSLADARAFFERRTDAATGAVDGDACATALALWIRVMTGEDPRSSPVVLQGAKFLLPHVPTAGAPDADVLVWYVGTCGLFQVGGLPWKTWNESLKTAVVDTQRRDTDTAGFRGSWDPVGAFGRRVGRVGTTAMLELALATYYRYDKVFGTKSADPTPANAPAPTKAEQAKASETIRDLKDDATGARSEAQDGLDGVRRRVQQVGSKTFLLDAGGRWVDTAWDGEAEPEVIEAFSEAYFALLATGDDVAALLAVGDRVLFVHGGKVYEVRPPGA